MKIKISMFFILFIIISFFKDLGIPVGIKGASVSVCFAITILLFSALFLFYRTDFINSVNSILRNKKNALWLFVLFILYVVFITLVYGILGKINLFSSILGIFLQYVVILLMTYCVAAYTSYRALPPSKIIKILYGTFWGILVLGIVDFIAYKLNISLLQQFLSLFFNTQTLSLETVYEKAIANNMARVQSIYFEPGFFAEYIFLLLPLMYSLATSKYKIYRNNFINFIIKRTTIPLLWTDLILTQSPIWIVFSLLSTIIYILKEYQYKKELYNRIFVFTFLFIFFPLILTIDKWSEIDWDKTFVRRIIKVVYSFSDIDTLIYNEQSLGTRLSNIIIYLDIGKESPIFGIGHSNLLPAITKRITTNNSPVYITREMKLMNSKKIYTGQCPPFVNIFTRYGLVGLILFYTFVIKIIAGLIKCRKYTDGVLNDFVYGLTGTNLSYLLISCYDILLGNLLVAMIFGISMGIYQYVYIEQKTLSTKKL